MAFSIEQNKIAELQLLNKNDYFLGGKIFVDDETLIKIVNRATKNELSYLLEIPEHEHVIKPLEVGQIINSDSLDPSSKQSSTYYRMRYLKETKTLLKMYKMNVSYEQKMEYAKQLFSALQFLHQYIVIGDIHSRNILVDEKNAYIIDLDDFKKPDIIKQIDCYYYINILRSFGNNKYTDIIKMYIECLSFILEINFPRFIRRSSYAEFYKMITSYNLPPEVLSFFKISCTSKFKSLGEEAYDFEKFMSPEILELKRELNFVDLNL